MLTAYGNLSIEFLVLTFTVFGLIVGSFLNVVILRLPKMLENNWKTDCCELLAVAPPDQTTPFNLVTPASHCPQCNHKIRPWENIPVVSYLFLKGKCSGCGNNIPIRYPLVELATGIISGLVAYQLGATTSSLFALILVWCLITLTMIDIDTQLLPDNITLPLLWLGLIANSMGLFTTLTSAVFGAIAGYLSLWSVYWLFKLITKKEGMGYGDFKLLAALGAWLGWQALPLIVILSSFVGAALGILGILIYGRDKNIPIPFGPYLAIAGLITLFWGEEISQFYLQISNLQ